MEFESQLGVFSPDGRLIQVEYAQNASAHGATLVLQAVESKIKIAYEIQCSNALLIQTPNIHVVDADRSIYIMYSGLKPDSLKVTKEAISRCRNYKYQTSEDIELRMLARDIGEFKQKYTVAGGYRPLGLRTILFGIEKGMPMIFIIETDGNFSEYRSCAVGNKGNEVMEYLEKSNGEECAFVALSKVVSEGTKKIKAFILSADGLNEVPENEIAEALRE